jgi:acyl carrier protein
MTKTEFAAYLEQIMKFEPGAIQADDLDSFPVQLDSIGVVEMLAAADENGVMAAPEAISAARTAGDLWRLISR